MVTLQQSLDPLVVPAAFARYDRIADTKVLAGLHEWKVTTEPSLNRLDSFDVSVLSLSEQANLVRVLAPLTATAEWSPPATRSLATARLSRIPASDRLIAHILTQVVKPLFASTPHPRLHASTARILPRPADVQDTYIEQPWKDHPGLDEVIRWCLLNTESSVYENGWPLFLPPVMSFLDDYQAFYRLLGVRLVSDMLSRVPPQLLLRTGVDTLIFNSLINVLSHLGDPSTPDLIRLAVATTLQLIDLTTPSMLPSDILLHGNDSQAMSVPPHSSQSELQSTRFSRLSILLSSSLLGTVIMYTPAFLRPVSVPNPDPFADPEHINVGTPEIPQRVLTRQRQSFNPTLIAAAQCLPPVLSALGIAGVRFLKGVIPVLVEWLALPLPVGTTEAGHDSGNYDETLFNVKETQQWSEPSTTDITLHLASLSSLTVLFHTCMPKIGGWSTTILDGIGRCWIGCLDIESQGCSDIPLKESLCALKAELKEIAVKLSRVYPDITKNEYVTLLAYNRTLFEGLLEGAW